MYRDWLGWGSTPQHQGLVRKKCCSLHFPWLALAPFQACPLAEMLNADDVPLGPLPEESLIRAIRWELEHTVVSYEVYQGSPGSRDHVSALLLVPWGSLNKIKTRRNHPSFCKTLQGVQNNAGWQWQVKTERGCSINFISWLMNLARATSLTDKSR